MGNVHLKPGEILVWRGNEDVCREMAFALGDGSGFPCVNACIGERKDIPERLLECPGYVITVSRIHGNSRDDALSTSIEDYIAECARKLRRGERL